MQCTYQFRDVLDATAMKRWDGVDWMNEVDPGNPRGYSIGLIQPVPGSVYTTVPGQRRAG